VPAGTPPAARSPSPRASPGGPVGLGLGPGRGAGRGRAGACAAKPAQVALLPEGTPEAAAPQGQD